MTTMRMVVIEKMIWRIALVAVLLFATPLAAEALQPPSTMPRLCYLAPYPAGQQTGYKPFLQGLRDLGHVEGRNLAIDYLSVDGRFERFEVLAAQCVHLKADIIVAVTTAGALAAKKATTTIPIVSPATGDPVATGIVASLPRPGGNVTGLSLVGPGLSSKRLELLKGAVPGLTKAAVLANFADPIAAPQVKDMESAARAFGIQLQVRDVRTPKELPDTFAAAVREGAQGVLTTIESIFLNHRAQIVELATRYRLPAVYPYRQFAEAGGLMAYGPDVASLFRRAATYVDKILKGAKPADLPVEQPTTFELVINMKTARAHGLTIPQSLLARADQVIE
jgi:putative ABC transport system substrate-binding protein